MDISKVFDLIFKLIDGKRFHREKLYEEEFLKLFAKTQAANQYFVEGLTELEQLLAALEKSDTLKSNNFDEAKIVPYNLARDAIKKIDRMRMETRSERIDLRAKAGVGSLYSTRYFGSAIFEILSEDERIAFKDFYQSVEFYFNSGFDTELHDLAEGIHFAYATISRILENNREPSIKVKAALAQARKEIAAHRQNCFDSWRLISTKFHIVETILKRAPSN